mmetsp:Transcript_128057/g.410374  ORF Transcript_128057/g.410374 Transcript_128057/m.410374 type:complete len:533 (-) Transcript_128057:392-1990(-)
MVPTVLLLRLLALHHLDDPDLTADAHALLLEAVAQLLGLLVHQVCPPRCPSSILRGDGAGGVPDRVAAPAAEGLGAKVAVVALGDVAEQQLAHRLRVHADAMNRHLARVQPSDVTKDLIVLRDVGAPRGHDVDLVAVVVRQGVVDCREQLASLRRQEVVDPIFGGLDGLVRGRRHGLGPEPGLATPGHEADQLEGGLRVHLGVQRPLERSPDVRQLPAQGAARVDDNHSVQAAGPAQGQQGPLHLAHDALDLLESIVGVGQQYVDVVRLQLALAEEPAQGRHRGPEELRVLLRLVDLCLGLPLEGDDICLGDVVVHWHGLRRCRTNHRLRPHEDSDECTRFLQVARADELADRGHVLRLGDEVALKALENPLAQLRSHVLDEPIRVVRVHLYGLARMVDLHELRGKPLRLIREVLAWPRNDRGPSGGPSRRIFDLFLVPVVAVGDGIVELLRMLLRAVRGQCGLPGPGLERLGELRRERDRSLQRQLPVAPRHGPVRVRDQRPHGRGLAGAAALGLAAGALALHRQHHGLTL